MGQVHLKEFGLTLAQIGSILADPPSTEVIAAMLTMRRDEADADRRRAEGRVRAIEARLCVLDRSTEMINAYDVVPKVSPAIRLATATRRLAPAGSDPHQLFVVFTPIGPAWSLYDRADDDDIVVHAGLPIPDDIDVSTLGIVLVSRPKAEVASAVHLGDVAEMAHSYAALMEWLEARSLRPQGGAAEISLVWDPEHRDRNVTELQITIASEG